MKSSSDHKNNIIQGNKSEDTMFASTEPTGVSISILSMLPLLQGVCEALTDHSVLSGLPVNSAAAQL